MRPRLFKPLCITVAAGTVAALSMPDLLAAPSPRPVGGGPGGGGAPPLATPTLSCVESTEHTITIEFCAGTLSYHGSDYGANAGFSIQWMTCEDFDNGVTVQVDNGDGTYTDVVVNNPGEWPGDSDFAADAGVLCKASFSGQAHETYWDLGPNECREITIGALNDLIADPNQPGGGPSGGVSTNCGGPLECETCYVFRSFAHNIPGGNQPKRSAFSDTISCDTAACEGGGDEIDACAFTKGGWAQCCQGSNVGCMRDDGWDTVYFSSGGILTVGGTNALVFTSSANAAAYVGSNQAMGGGLSNQFVASFLDPCTNDPCDQGSSCGTITGGRNLAPQTVALRLNVDYSDAGVSCGFFGGMGGCGTPLGDLVLCNLMDGNLALDGSALTPAQEAALNGQSIRQVLAAAEAYLGGDTGLPYGLSHGQLTALVSQFNEGFEFDLDGDGDCDPGTGFSMDFICLP